MAACSSLSSLKLPSLSAFWHTLKTCQLLELSAVHAAFVCCGSLSLLVTPNQYMSQAQINMCACSAQEAIISGFFKGQPGPEAQAAAGDSSADPELKPGSDKQPGARMDALLSTAMEVANGMMYLHARSIVHGDLTGANVLLQECAVGLLCPALPGASRTQPALLFS